MNMLAAPGSLSLSRSELAPGEIHFIYWFIQGGIMDPYSRQKLHKAWGMCERHAWGWMSVEAAFRHEFIHGPAVLYEDLMERAVMFCDVRGPMRKTRVWTRLREKGPCLMCDAGFGPRSRGRAKPELIERGGDLTQIRLMAQKTFPYWRKDVCGKCANTTSTVRCRKHFLEKGNRCSEKEFDSHKEFVTSICHHLVKFARSFRFQFQHTRTDEDAAALLSAVGWCSGWKTFLSIVG